VKVLGFGIIVLGLLMIYVGETGAQHSIMSIIKNGPETPSGQKINPTGTGDSGTTNTGGGSSGTQPEPVQEA
jgi:hypothetical protein